MKIYLTICCILMIINLLKAEDCKGSVALDSTSFEKIINKFKASIVKFDVAYPYGDKHDEFCKVATSLKDTPDLLVAHVGVKDFGMKDNLDLAEQFDIKKEDFPTILLFKQDHAKPEKILTTESADFTADNIKNNIKRKTDIYIVLPGCIEKFDKLANEYIKSKENEKKEIIKTATNQAEKLPKSQQSTAKIYVKYMEKILDQGNNYVNKETVRLSGLLKEKLSDVKKQSLVDKLNILKSFAFDDEQSLKTEL